MSTTKQKNKIVGTHTIQHIYPIVDILTSSPSEPQKLKQQI
jgi:hypothetical protein